MGALRHRLNTRAELPREAAGGELLAGEAAVGNIGDRDGAGARAGDEDGEDGGRPGSHL